MEGFKEISVYEIENAQKLIGKDWMLITAGNTDGGYNTMTASWGCMGILWNEPVCIGYIRPQRYTYVFTEANERLSMCFFDEDMRDALKFCGVNSGRDVDKAKECGLTVEDADGTVIFKEARLALICEKIYVDDIKEECFIDRSLLSHYPKKDFHRAYVCRVVKAYSRA